MDTDIAPEVGAWAAKELPYFLTFKDDLVTVGVTTPMTIADYVAQWQANTDTIFRGEGTSINGKRRHKVAFFTRDTFADGPLKGLFVGGGHRYQSRMALGVRPDFAVVEGNSYWHSDLLLGCNVREFAFFKRGLRLRLNINNLFDRTTPTISGAQVLASGETGYNRIRLVEYSHLPEYLRHMDRSEVISETDHVRYVS